jgi:hypothetical protein
MPVVKADTDTSSSSQNADTLNGAKVGAINSTRIVAMRLTVLKNYSMVMLLLAQGVENLECRL